MLIHVTSHCVQVLERLTAASYLRAHGADTILTQHFLKDDVDTYINRSELIRTVEVQDNGIAIAHGSNEKFIILLQLHKARMSC